MSQVLKIRDDTWQRIVNEGWQPKNRSVDVVLNELFNERDELRRYVAAMQQMQNVDKDKMDKLTNALVAIFENVERGKE